jgi:lysophospholipase L1-like esterase
MIGDSIIRGADTEVMRELTSDLRVARLFRNNQSVRHMQGPMQQMVNLRHPQVLVVELGVNDAGYGRTSAQMRADIRRFLSWASPRVPCVRWLDLKLDITYNNPSYNSGAPTFNRILREEAGRFSNVRVAPLNAWAQANRSSFWFDDLHMGPTGKVPYARWIEHTVIASCWRT